MSSSNYIGLPQESTCWSQPPSANTRRLTCMALYCMLGVALLKILTEALASLPVTILVYCQVCPHLCMDTRGTCETMYSAELDVKRYGYSSCALFYNILSRSAWKHWPLFSHNTSSKISSCVSKTIVRIKSTVHIWPCLSCQ